MEINVWNNIRTKTVNYSVELSKTGVRQKYGRDGRKTKRWNAVN